ncbi:MAG: M48 family metallopeptidase [Hyphomicrobiaceae bacterium]
MIRIPRQRPVVSALAVTATALSIAACAAVDGVTTQFATSSTHETFKGTFIDTAIDRVRPHYRLAAGVTDPKSLRSPLAVPRAFSGEPSYKSEEAIQAINESGGIVVAPKAQAYLQRVLDRLLSHWPFETPRIGVFITTSPGFGALATPDGDILVFAGSLLTFRSEDELAAMLAHEASHILLRHHERAAQNKATKKLANAAVQAAVIGFTITNSSLAKTAPNQYQWQIKDPAKLRQQTVRTAAVCLGARYFIDRILDPQWNRSQEDEADLLGVDLLHRAGYDLSGSLQTLKHQRDADVEAGKRLKTQRRADAGEYDKIVAEQVKTQGIGGIISGGAMAITQGVVNTFQDLDEQLAQRHRLTELRQKSLAAYISRQYVDRERKALSQNRYKEILANGGMIATLKNHQAAFEAFRAIEGGDLAKAEAKASEAIRPPTAHAPAPRYMMFLVLQQKGDREGAFRQLQAIRGLEAAPAIIIGAYAFELESRGRHIEAARYARIAFEKAGISPSAPKEQQEKALVRLFGFDTKGPCDAVNDNVKALVTRLGGDKVDQRPAGGITAATVARMQERADHQRAQEAKQRQPAPAPPVAPDTGARPTVSQPSSTQPAANQGLGNLVGGAFGALGSVFGASQPGQPAQ